MAGGDKIRPDLVRHRKQRAELNQRIAADTRIRRSALEVFRHEILDDLPFKDFSTVADLVCDAKLIGNAARFLCGAIRTGVHPQRHAMHIAALLTKYGGRHGAVDPAAHSDDHSRLSGAHMHFHGSAIPGIRKQSHSVSKGNVGIKGFLERV